MVAFGGFNHGGVIRENEMIETILGNIAKESNALVSVLIAMNMAQSAAIVVLWKRLTMLADKYPEMALQVAEKLSNITAMIREVIIMVRGK